MERGRSCRVDFWFGVELGVGWASAQASLEAVGGMCSGGHCIRQIAHALPVSSD